MCSYLADEVDGDGALAEKLRELGLDAETNILVSPIAAWPGRLSSQSAVARQWMGQRGYCDALGGRVLVESIEVGPDYEKLPLETRTLLTATDEYAVIPFSPK